jgi:outer membrane protein OmpA-like peptidoglycan-associated protein
MTSYKTLFGLASFCAAGLLGAAAQAAPAAAAAPDSIVIYFDTGSASMRADDLLLLDKAARLYRDGHPILMTVSAGADATGSPVKNLHLSQERADAVFQGLVARGIPADRFQIVAKGQTDPAVQTEGEEPKNRRAEITWK